MFQSTGTLHFEKSDRLKPPFKLVLNIDQGISDFYYSLIPKWKRARKQAFAAHISVVRKERADPDRCKRYEGKMMIFEYEPYLQEDNVYYWLDAYSLDLEQVRMELGLANAPLYPAPWHRPMPEGTPYTKRFHITVGNTKTLT